MNIVFGKMTIDNFISFDKEEFNFKTHKGLSLIGGINNDISGSRNGCGKSALVSSFTFCLFGKMINQMSIKNVPNRYLPPRPTEVTLDFEVDGVEYTIISGIKVNPQTGYCKVFKGDEDLTKHSVKETRQFIEKNILKIEFDVFLRSFVLTSDQFYNFFKMSKSDKRVFIENIFDLKVFGEMYRNIHRDNLDNTKRLNVLDALVTSQRRDLNLMNKTSLEFESNKAIQIKSLKGEISDLKDSCTKHAKILRKFKIKDLTDKKSSLDAISNSVFTKKSEYLSTIKTTKSRIIHKTKLLKEKNEYVLNYNETYSHLSEESKPVVSEKLGLSTVKLDIKTITAEITSDKQSVIDLTKKASNLIVSPSVTEAIVKIDKALGKLSSTKTTFLHNKKTHKDKTIQLATLIKSENTITELVTTKQEEFDTNSEELNVSSVKKNTLTFIEKIVNEESIRKLVVVDLIKLLNNQIQTYLISMGSNFTCMFDENLNYTFLTKNGEAEYSSFSGGEKMRLSIATSMAFRDFIINRSGINSSVLILDEYIDSGIDDLAVTEIFKILREFHVLYDQNIFIVSHREAVKLNAFDHVISVDKTNGLSKIVESV